MVLVNTESSTRNPKEYLHKSRVVLTYRILGTRWRILEKRRGR